MAADWRIGECVNQLLLCAAFKARAAVLDRNGSSIEVTPPLPPFDDLPRGEDAQRVFDRIRADPDDTQRFHVFVKFVKWICNLPNRPISLNNIAATTPWQINEVVTWWIQAGITLAEWEWGRPVAGSRTPAGLPPSSDAPSSLDWYLNVVRRHLRLEDDEEHPAFWLARHAEGWRIARDQATIDPADPRDQAAMLPDDRADSREACLRALLAWCGDPRRETRQLAKTAAPGAGDRWAEDYENRYWDFARAGRHLLRQPCRFGDGNMVSPRSGEWSVCPPPPSLQHVRVLRRPIHSAGHRVVPGWVTVPRPNVLVALLEKEWPTMPSAPRSSIDHAIARATIWTEADSTFWPPHSPPGKMDLPSQAKQIMAVASLAMIMGPGPYDLSPPLNRALNSCHRAWATEGIDAHWDPAGSGGRIVPMDCSPMTAVTPGAGRLTLNLPGSVGIVVGQVGHIDDAPVYLLEAIEELDWRLWVVPVLRETGRLPTNLGWLVDFVHRLDWEPQKRQLLTANPSDSVSIHDALNRSRLQLTRDTPIGADRSLPEWLGAAMRKVEEALCRSLAADAPDRVARVSPPRTATGMISIQAWLPTGSGQRVPTSWGIRWKESPEPFGSVQETLDREGRRWAECSAGQQPDAADLRVLEAVMRVIDTDEPCVTRIASRLVPWFERSLAEKKIFDLASEFTDLRTWCAGEGGDSFDQLMHAAVKGIPVAIEWARLLHDDSRFGFSCHPAVEVTNIGVQRLPPSVDDELEWGDHDELAPGTDISVRYAIDATRARRVVSRGRPAAESAEALAGRLVAAVTAGPPDLIERAAKASRATDRRWMFNLPPDRMADEVTAVAAALLAGAAELGSATPEAWRCLRAWSSAIGFAVTPGDWHPTEGAGPDELPVEATEFHDTVPAGRLIVRRFAVARADGPEIVARQSAVSAGPTPAGYAVLRDLVTRLPDTVIGKLQASVLDLPARVQAGRGENAVATLFKEAWDAAIRHPKLEDLRQVTDAVHLLAARMYDYVVFRPTTLGEYGDNWILTSDNKPAQGPRGLRIERLIRPGLRTIDDKLKHPALVEIRK